MAQKLPNVLSMDASKLTMHVRKSFERNLIHSWTIEEVRDVAFQVLANKEEYKKNGKDLLKTYYTLTRGSNPGLYKQSLGFPFINGHLRSHYKVFSEQDGGEKMRTKDKPGTAPDAIPGQSGKSPVHSVSPHDILLINCSKFMSKRAVKVIHGHFCDNVKETILDYLTKSGEFINFYVYEQRVTVKQPKLGEK
ncbi:hypothetical protein BEWA_036910 [Theileria equi strain WA]|uniref:Uncharacterized protein n=1 Tax=Theileria equi strain WA TaxID=1537102 RepID=L1LEH6_THEEQ|nr:hypothetical protein BEWA_036910 [Theileria equi strain WA]EKX73655.1 hypothetical protein BEWA_036910 [Theileria equi strain WA]|eukprot:XP_004833107.1 hypothetical protein BEWA_036910 [Theileria equi strain WA]